MELNVEKLFRRLKRFRRMFTRYDKLDTIFLAFRTCIHNRGMPDGRGFFSPDKEIFRSHTDV